MGWSMGLTFGESVKLEAIIAIGMYIIYPCHGIGDLPQPRERKYFRMALKDKI
jgi:hypothetical protein